ncbi:MAG: hypothetical protein AB7G10_28840, partial [Reyranellaceae bacterium]
MHRTSTFVFNSHPHPSRYARHLPPPAGEGNGPVWHKPQPCRHWPRLLRRRCQYCGNMKHQEEAMDVGMMMVFASNGWENSPDQRV